MTDGFGIMSGMKVVYWLPAAAWRKNPEDLRARIEDAQDLWATRVELARAQWTSKLKLKGASEAAFNAALQEMNDKLYDSMEALAAIINEQEKMTPELGLRLLGETTTLLAETYDRIGASVSPVLLAQTDVLSVTTGVSLEEALGMDAD